MTSLKLRTILENKTDDALGDHVELIGHVAGDGIFILTGKKNFVLITGLTFLNCILSKCLNSWNFFISIDNGTHEATDDDFFLHINPKMISEAIVIATGFTAILKTLESTSVSI